MPDLGIGRFRPNAVGWLTRGCVDDFAEAQGLTLDPKDEGLIWGQRANDPGEIGIVLNMPRPKNIIAQDQGCHHNTSWREVRTVLSQINRAFLIMVSDRGASLKW